jgi:hypothetical protein
VLHKKLSNQNITSLYLILAKSIAHLPFCEIKAEILKTYGFPKPDKPLNNILTYKWLGMVYVWNSIEVIPSGFIPLVLHASYQDMVVSKKDISQNKSI